MPNPACSTSFDGCRQPNETTDQPAVTRSGSKPWVMAELEAGTDVYFKAFIAKQTETQLRLRFPACQETEDEEVLQWVSRCSSRLWRGPNSKGVWSKMHNGEGAWRPKKVAKIGKAPGRPAKRRATLASDVKEEECSAAAEETQHKEVQEDRQEGMAECSHRGNTVRGSTECANTDSGPCAAAAPQEPEVLYALPEDRLAAWFYMHELVCANDHMIPWMNSQHKNAESEEEHSQPAQPKNPAAPLMRDDSAFESEYTKVSNNPCSKVVAKRAPKVMDQAVAARAVTVKAGR